MANDALIHSKLRQKLQRSKLRTDKLEFTVRDGTVEWRGNVAVPQRKGVATRMAKAAGASKVLNRIVIANNGSISPKPKLREVGVKVAGRP
jgi:osmotically-inducible protein OsmY